MKIRIRALKIAISVILLLLAATMSVGCSEYVRCDGTGFSSGYKPTPEQFSSLSDMIFNSSKPEDEPLDIKERLFYWTSGGSKLHLYDDCAHLKSSSSVNSGDIEAVIESEKSEICSSCLTRAGKTAEDFDVFEVSSSTIDTESQVPTDTVSPIEITENTVYYWTDSGTKFHIFKDCYHIENSPKEVLFGKLDDANKAGKDNPCSTCLDKAGIDIKYFS